MQKSKYGELVYNGLLPQNPVLIQVLGMCPVLAVSTSLINGIGMGIAATAVLVCSNILISLLRRYIPEKIRIAAYIVIIAGFVTAVDLIMKAYFEALSSQLGIFIPLIVVNCIILARAEMFASKNRLLPSLVDGIGMGLGFTAALGIISSVREILGNGTLLGHQVFGDDFLPATMMLMPVGAFLVLGITIAAVQYIQNRTSERRNGK